VPPRVCRADTSATIRKVARNSRPSATDASCEDNWHGGFYELSIKLGEADDARLDAALVALWRAAALPEPFRRKTGQAAELSAHSLLEGHLHSVATIPGLGPTLCSVIVVREETYDSGVTRFGADWLDLCLPLGALGNLDERVGAYPFGRDVDAKAWREPIELWFAAVAAAVFDVVPFVHAVTGHEVSGLEPSEVKQSRLGVFRRGMDGKLEVERVRAWSS
jgi:hypothetical protein